MHELSSLLSGGAGSARDGPSGRVAEQLGCQGRSPRRAPPGSRGAAAPGAAAGWEGGPRGARAPSLAVEGQQAQGLCMDRRIPCRNYLSCTPAAHVPSLELRLREARSPRVAQMPVPLASGSSTTSSPAHDDHSMKAASDACCVRDEEETAARQQAVVCIFMTGAVGRGGGRRGRHQLGHPGRTPQRAS